MEFEYVYRPVEETGFPLVGMPVIDIELNSPLTGGSFTYPCLVDSGADSCVFHAEIGEALGLDVKSGQEVDLHGIKANSPLKGYRHDIVYKIGGVECPAKVVFTYEFSSRYGILGRKGFFDHFTVEINERDGKVKITPNA